MVTYNIVQGESARNPVATLLKLLGQSHHVQGVKAVDDSGAQIVRAKDAADVRSFADRLQFVLTPGVQLVVVPCV